ncbi:flavin-containing monooxygenase [Sphingomonas sp. M1-B02]|uniref:flavin-containing monooxygenase n=1 Tax=Sphingomonas sp. M1-B02 TaxID=3114300 RepID=UPI00223FC7E5|nr:NAD(P)/FAD-dependent oxidoreductase [Sphingomonas sp. S6-11]UZK67286.1 NAD(P)/FAD-dependent oxidoreductase [Sphingomonas sp. S6-11]
MDDVSESAASSHSAGKEPIRAAVIGAGMAGILSAIKLNERGIDVVVFEKGDRVGGTWRENTYPGLACDVAAHWYTYSFARNPEWDSLMAPGPKIREYFEGVARDRGVLPRIRFGQEVVRLDYEGPGWRLATATGHEDRFDVVIVATGVLHHPNVPHFDGVETFNGAVFHSARWDHSVALDGKRIGVVGTGSTAAQLVTALVPRASRFSLFQRTPQWVMHRPNPAYTEAEKAAFRADPATLDSLVQELRTRTVEGYATAVIDQDSPQLAAIEHLCQENLEKVRNPELRRKLTPDYRAACKRLVMSDGFYEAIQQPNAELVTSRIDRIEPEGVRTADGALHELDVLVLSTGFQVDRFIRPTKVIGRGGRDLDDAWADGPEAYISVSVPDFPNLFLVNGPGSPFGNFSAIETSEFQAGYVMQLIDGLIRGDYREVSVTHEALRRFEDERQEAGRNTVWVTGCDSWYLDKKGVPTSWTFSYDRFVQEMAAPRMQDFETQ